MLFCHWEGYTGEALQLQVSCGCQEPCQVPVRMPSYHPMAWQRQNQVGPLLHPALRLCWGKIQKYQQKEKNSAFNRLPGLDRGGTRTVGSTAKSNCHAACTQAGRRGACSHHCCGIACKGRCVPVFLSALSDAHSHPSRVRSAGSLSHHVCTLCDSSVAQAFMLYCYTVKTVKVFCWDNSQYKALTENPQAKATPNNKREFRVHKTSVHC